jgi:hypothetical protein
MIHEDTACEGGAASIFSKELLAGVKARYVKYQQLGMFTASNGRNYSGNFNEFRVWGAKENYDSESYNDHSDEFAQIMKTFRIK